MRASIRQTWCNVVQQFRHVGSSALTPQKTNTPKHFLRRHKHILLSKSEHHYSTFCRHTHYQVLPSAETYTHWYANISIVGGNKFTIPSAKNRAEHHYPSPRRRVHKTRQFRTSPRLSYPRSILRCFTHTCMLKQHPPKSAYSKASPTLIHAKHEQSRTVPGNTQANRYVCPTVTARPQTKTKKVTEAGKLQSPPFLDKPMSASRRGGGEVEAGKTGARRMKTNLANGNPETRPLQEARRRRNIESNEKKQVAPRNKSKKAT